MKKMNLKDYYYYIKEDVFVEVEDEVYQTFEDALREERNLNRKMHRHTAQYSLDVGDGIENGAVFMVESLEELYFRKMTAQELYGHLLKLPPEQGRRIFARYYQKLSDVDIAKQEGVVPTAVGQSIRRGLARLEKNLKKLQ